MNKFLSKGTITRQDVFSIRHFSPPEELEDEEDEELRDIFYFKEGYNE